MDIQFELFNLSDDLSKLSPHGNFHQWSKKKKEKKRKKKGRAVRNDLGESRTDPLFSSVHSINRRRERETSLAATIPRSFRSHRRCIDHRENRTERSLSRSRDDLSNGRIPSSSSPSWVQFVRITSWITPQNRVVCCAPIIDAPQPT